MAKVVEGGKEPPQDSTPASGRWFLGERQRHYGSLHQDDGEGTGEQLASCSKIAVFPVGGWWKQREPSDRMDETVRYSLVVSLVTPKEEIDLYTPVATQVSVPILTEITV